jgi:LmbE family N-acetylglucosaminyl deacetylase
MTSRSVLVVVAHPDDEALGFAGIIARARSEGLSTKVAVVTNGDSPRPGKGLPCRGAQAGPPAGTVRYGLRRAQETISAMSLLGLRWHSDLGRSDLYLLGYRNGLLRAMSEKPGVSDPTGLDVTYAPTGGRLGRWRRGDLRFLRQHRHAPLSTSDLASDLDSLLEIAQPSDIYTHAEFDGHPDHTEVHRQLVAALKRRGMAVTLHTTLIHPEDTADTMYESALEWPNPADGPGGPYARFTPDLGFDPPPVDGGYSWGPLGAPDELVEVPDLMRRSDPNANLKWQTISRYRSQISCRERSDGTRHASCGYLRAFVKRHEFFWRSELG